MNVSRKSGKPLIINGIATIVTATLSMCSATAPSASAIPQGVPCGVLDQIHQSLDDDITAGVNGVRQTIGSLYLYPDSIAHKRDVDANLARVNDGIHHIQDINNGHPVPGLGASLRNLERAAADMNTAVTALITPGEPVYESIFGNGPPGYHFALPQPSTWETIDFVDQKKNDVYGLVNNLHGQCSP